MIVTRTYNEPPICEKEMLRYAGCKSSEDELLQPLRACIEEVRERLSYKVCYRELPVKIVDDRCDFGFFTISSRDLARNLKDCSSVILFAATVGIEMDRLIARYARVSPSKAVLLQGIGAERIESLCDKFCEDIVWEKRCSLRPRYSPGYGDVPLEAQKYFFEMLDCAKQIGVSLNESLLMSPSKSVTAFVGITERTDEENERNVIENRNKCVACKKTDCAYRGVL